MNNIIWLASYPKSGNTWFRFFLTNLQSDCDEPADINRMNATPIASARNFFDEAVGFDSGDLSYAEVDNLRPEVYEYLSNQSTETRFFKIHDAYTLLDDGRPLVSPWATKGVIYIVRNPLDVTVSFANHSGISIEKSMERINDQSFCLCNNTGEQPNQLRQRLLSWSGHVRSWMDNNDLDVKMMRYEDMQSKPETTFTDAILFAGLNYSSNQIKKALKFSSFGELQHQESTTGFKERAPNCERFFHNGKVGYWKEVLTDQQIRSIVSSHQAVMKRCGYIDHKGDPVY